MSPCVLSYYGSSGTAVDPECHSGATAVQSNRRSQHDEDRVSLTLDQEWFATGAVAGSALRAGIRNENAGRDIGRDWHQILNAALSFNWNEQPYRQQYDFQFPQHGLQWYVEEMTFAACPEWRRQAVPDRRIAGGPVQHRSESGGRFGFRRAPVWRRDARDGSLGSGPPWPPIELECDQQLSAQRAGPQRRPARARDCLERRSRAAIRGGRLALSATWYNSDLQNRIL